MTLSIFADSQRVEARLAFPALALVLVAYFFAASAPSPLFVVFQHLWGFSSGMLALAFGIYAITLLCTLLVAGSLSDHLGRKPVILAALALQTVAMVVFVAADGIGQLLLARGLQGVATGIASGALSAAVVEAAPAQRKALGAVITSVAPLTGLALGALVTGGTVSLIPHPHIWIFSGLAVLFPLCALAVWSVPETSARRAGLLHSLVPRIELPASVSVLFWLTAPALIVTWAVCGLYLAFAPSWSPGLFGIDSGLFNGATIAVLCGAGAVTPPMLRQLPSGALLKVALLLLAGGISAILGAFGLQHQWLFLLATAAAGAGMGSAFSAVIQGLAPRVDEHQRAGVFAAIFIVSYLSLSLPPILAGFAAARFGLMPTLECAFAALVAVALIALLLAQVAHRQR